MPTKRKCNISKNSSRARAMKVRRSQESSVQAELRRQQQARRQSNVRATETPLQTQVRLERNAEQQAARGARETPQETQTRRIILSEMQTTRRQNFVRKEWSVFNNTGFQYDPLIDYHNHALIVIGSMSKKCRYCDAYKWNDETAGMCCSNGKVSLTLLGEPAEPLKTLLLGATEESKQFLCKIRRYNCCFQMTSFGVDRVLTLPGFPTTFTVQGQIYHQIGSLFPEGNEQHKFLQVYFMGDEQHEANRRCEYIEGAERDTVLKLQRMLHHHNFLVKIFKNAIQNWPSDTYKVVIHADQTPRGEHERRYNAPMVNEVAVLVTGDPCSPRDIVIRAHDNTLKRVADTHKFYDALQYPLIFSNT